MERTFAPIKRLKNLLTNGNLWLYLLSLMEKRGELYAYSAGADIESEFFFRPNRIMVYVVLYKLEAEGLIRSEFRERRKYYRLTKKGRGAIASAREYFALLSGKL
ncbi:PadR family transcriptional regulator [Candidatus Micrarchaeota archaeon]|nr:PadR family transcriptional regulator [Candidatus Micrarchaeota archaeon]